MATIKKGTYRLNDIVDLSLFPDGESTYYLPFTTPRLAVEANGNTLILNNWDYFVINVDAILDDGTRWASVWYANDDYGGVGFYLNYNYDNPSYIPYWSWGHYQLNSIPEGYGQLITVTEDTTYTDTDGIAFATWFKANTKTAKLITANTYKWNDELTNPFSFVDKDADSFISLPLSTSQGFNIDFDTGTFTPSTNPNIFSKLNLHNFNDVWFMIVYMVDDIISYPIYDSTNDDKWAFVSIMSQVGVDVGPDYSDYGQIITVTKDTYVPALFADWAEANWSIYEEPTTTSTTITYNGTEIATLESGQTATLTCAEQIMESSIIITFGADGTITYNGTTYTVTNGQKATISFADNIARTDIVIALS